MAHTQDKFRDARLKGSQKKKTMKLLAAIKRRNDKKIRDARVKRK